MFSKRPGDLGFPRTDPQRTGSWESPLFPSGLPTGHEPWCPMNRAWIRSLLESAVARGAKGARHRFGARAHHLRSKAASPFSRAAPPNSAGCLCPLGRQAALHRTESVATAPLRLMDLMCEILVGGILSPASPALRFHFSPAAHQQHSLRLSARRREVAPGLMLWRGRGWHRPEGWVRRQPTRPAVPFYPLRQSAGPRTRHHERPAGWARS